MLRIGCHLSSSKGYYAMVPDVRAEGGQVGGGVAEELFLEVVKQVKQVVVTTVKGNHTKHHKTLLHSDLFGSDAGRTGPEGCSQNLQS